MYEKRGKNAGRNIERNILYRTELARGKKGQMEIEIKREFKGHSELQWKE